MRKILLLIFLLNFSAYAEELILDIDSDLTPKSPEGESYSPFEILDDKQRHHDSSNENFNLSDELLDAEIISPEESRDIIKSRDFFSPEGGRFYNFADVILINKVTAKSKIITLEKGAFEYFGNVQILVEKCWFNNDPYNPAHKMLVKVIQHKIDEDPADIYHGWLISSNIPACNMQSPTYEIIASKCHDGKIKSK